MDNFLIFIKYAIIQIIITICTIKKIQKLNDMLKAQLPMNIK